MPDNTQSKLTLETLPSPILGKIIELLPQVSKINLALTNYQLYTTVIPIIYKRLCFRKDPYLLSSKGASFQESLFTSIYGSSNILASSKSKNQFFKLRQEILLQSLTLNETLLPSIEEVVIFNENDGDASSGDSFVYELFDLIKNRAINLKSYIVFSGDSRLHLKPKDFNTLKSIESVVLPHIDTLQYLPPSVQHIRLDFIDGYKHEHPHINGNFDRNTCLKILYNLRSLDLSGDEILTTDFLKYFFDVLKPNTAEKFKLERLKIIVYHGFNDYNILCRQLVKDFLFQYCDHSALKSLEIICGCDEMACPCLGEFFDEFLNLPTPCVNLENIAFSQKTVHRDHNYTEKFDVSICAFLRSLASVANHIRSLSIRHMPPLDSKIGNGFEGNYMKRRDIYGETLPHLTNLEILIAPLFMQSIACYEQLTSDLLWNGCECDYCNDYLPLFDEYIMKHFYFDETTGLEKDVISSVLFGAASDVMSNRIYSKNDIYHGASDLDILHFPAVNTAWGFHGYFGLRHQNGYNCQFNQSVFPSLIKVISHFLRDYVKAISEKNSAMRTFCLNGVYFNVCNNDVCCTYDATE